MGAAGYRHCSHGKLRPTASPPAIASVSISTGTSPFDSSLLGVSANGNDVYFFTRDTLVPQDENGELVKIYDARGIGGFYVTPEPPPCKASDECHGAGSRRRRLRTSDRSTGTSGNEVTATRSARRASSKSTASASRKPKSHKHQGKKDHHGHATDHRGGKK